jgi:hypothetical protein
MLKTLALFVVLAFPIFAQAPVFNNFNPTTQGVTIGTERCTIWAKLAGPWPTEVACYNGTTVTQIQVGLTGTVMLGSYKSASGMLVTWIIQPSGAWQLAAQTSAGVEAKTQGVF